ncbi:ABC transporter permease [Candidatus Woesearchaeota archaeon]|nr:ABC transporter permease [Candidatus Woesearchaeota archaeon]
MMQFYARFALNTFARRRLRSWLTMLGIFIGIAAIVSLISLGQGLKTAIGTQFSALGTDRIIVQAKSLNFGPPGQGAVAQLTTNDQDAIERVSGVSQIAGRMLKSAKVEFNDRTQFSFVASMPDTPEGRHLIEDMFRLKTDQGRLIDAGDRKKVVVGSNVADKDQFGKPVEVGARLEINDETFEVIGVMTKLGQPQIDGSILMPDDAMRELYGLDKEVSAIVVQGQKGLDPIVLADRITKRLRSFRNVEEGREDFTVQTSGQLLDTLGTILNVVTAVLAGIAGISLLVGGIGIMNTMYTSVLERRKDIGLMKSVGAKTRDILMMFLMESGLLGLAGGAIGIALGVLMGLLVQVIASQALGPGLIQASFPWYLLVGALMFSFIVGSVAGTLPAIQASRLNPVDALRGA